MTKKSIDSSVKERVEKVRLTLRDQLVGKLRALDSIGLINMDDGDLTRTWYPTNLPMLDRVLGYGIPGGCMIEIFGAESAGKTTLALDRAAYMQQNYGAIVVLFDAEHSMDADMIRRTNLDTRYLLPVDYDICGNMALIFDAMSDYASMTAEIIDKAKTDETVPVIFVWDSVGGTSTKSEALMRKKGMTATRIGEVASLLTEGLKNVKPIIKTADICLLVCNQIRANIGVMFGETEKSVGGHAFLHFADVRLRIKLGAHYKSGSRATESGGGIKQSIERGGEAVGILSKLYGKKNKVSSPARSCTIATYFKTGVSIAHSALLYGAYEVGVVAQPKTGKFEYGGMTGTIFNMVEKLESSPKVLAQLLEDLREAGADPEEDDGDADGEE